MSEEVDQLRQEIAELREQLLVKAEELEQKAKELEEKNEQLEQKNEEFDQFQQTSEDYEKELEVQNDQMTKKCQELQAKCERLTSNNDQLNEKLEQYTLRNEQHISHLEEQLKRFTKERDELKTQVRILEQQNDDLERQQRNTCAQVQDIDEKLREAYEKNALLETVLGEHDEKNVLIQRLKDEINELKNDLIVKSAQQEQREQCRANSMVVAADEQPSSWPAMRTFHVATQTHLDNGLSNSVSVGRNSTASSPQAHLSHSVLPAAQPDNQTEALSLVGDMLRKVQKLETKLRSCKSAVRDCPSCSGRASDSATSGLTYGRLQSSRTTSSSPITSSHAATGSAPATGRSVNAGSGTALPHSAASNLHHHHYVPLSTMGSGSNVKSLKTAPNGPVGHHQFAHSSSPNDKSPFARTPHQHHSRASQPHSQLTPSQQQQWRRPLSNDSSSNSSVAVNGHLHDAAGGTAADGIGVGQVGVGQVGAAHVGSQPASFLRKPMSRPLFGRTSAGSSSGLKKASTIPEEPSSATSSSMSAAAKQVLKV